MCVEYNFDTWSIQDIEREQQRYRDYLAMALRENLSVAEEYAKHLDRLEFARIRKRDKQ